MLEITDILSANLGQLHLTAPDLAARVLEAIPSPVHWLKSQAGPWSATIDHQGASLSLASRYDPLAQATKLASTVDHSKHGGIIVLGVGLGYHVAKIAQQMSDQCLMVVFEPDIGLLRAVLEKIDHTAWLGRPNVVLASEGADRAWLLGRVEKFAGVLTQGTILVTNPPSRQLSSQPLADFGQMVTDVLAYCRTNVATTLVNASRTYRNLSLNLPHYVAGANTDELFNAASGRPAVCVGAGPSLARNIDLLRDQKTRDNVVVISAQTTLKPLLDRGIKPDFVTALDYHEISKRFYEGLPPLPDVTLVAEPMANPTILDSFPGPVRVTHHSFLDLLLGDLASPMIPIPYGATVAHLSFYLAQHLGCDPIILIGQDLGFSDGLYYCPGTAIHDVWAPEFGPFNTVETMEWQRIVRHRAQLKKLQDIHGQPIYTDEQMQTYLKQFERDFANAQQQVLDATEGGLPKPHTQAITLAKALAQHATQPVPTLAKPSTAFDYDRLAATAKLLKQRTQQVVELRQLTVKTVPLLQQMLEHQRDQARMNKLFKQMQPIQTRVAQLAQPFNLVNHLNAVGAFKRARADRAIHTVTDHFERQQQQIERDLENLDWLIQACDETLEIFSGASDRVEQHLNQDRSDNNQPFKPTLVALTGTTSQSSAC